MSKRELRDGNKLGTFVDGGAMDPECRLIDLERRLKQDLLPTPEELNGLLRLCRHPLPRVRDKALLLLLTPPSADEIAYYRWLISQVIEPGAKIRDLPEALLEVFCDIYAFLDGVPPSSSLHAPFERVVKHLPKGPRRRLFRKSYALRPFVAQLSAGFFSCRERALPAATRRRLRILQRLLAELDSRDPCCELTLADVQPILAIRGTRGKSGRLTGNGRWRRIGRTLLLPGGDHPPGPLQGRRPSSAAPAHRRRQAPPGGFNEPRIFPG